MSETRKLAATLDVDLVCNGRLTGADEERTRARLCGVRRDLIDPTIALLHGRVLDRAGDGTIVEFRAAIFIADMVSSFEWAAAVLYVVVVLRRRVAPVPAEVSEERCQND